MGFLRNQRESRMQWKPKRVSMIFFTIWKSRSTVLSHSLSFAWQYLIRYRARFHSSRPPNKLTRGFESSSWRVMRQPPPSPYHFSPYNATFGDEASRDIHIGTIFATTRPRIGSTFLLHPNWVWLKLSKDCRKHSIDNSIYFCLQWHFRRRKHHEQPLVVVKTDDFSACLRRGIIWLITSAKCYWHLLDERRTCLDDTSKKWRDSMLLFSTVVSVLANRCRVKRFRCVPATVRRWRSTGNRCSQLSERGGQRAIGE